MSSDIKVTDMPGSLDFAKLRLTEAMENIKAGNTQAALIQLKEANELITQFQQRMLNVMNSDKTPSPLMTAGNPTEQHSIPRSE